jgi:hypothetical protein
MGTGVARQPSRCVNARLAMLATYRPGICYRLRFAGRAMWLHAQCFDALVAHLRTAA